MEKIYFNPALKAARTLAQKGKTGEIQNPTQVLIASAREGHNPLRATADSYIALGQGLKTSGKVLVDSIRNPWLNK